jgi:integrase
MDGRNVVLFKFFRKHFVKKLGLKDTRGRPATLHGFRSTLSQWCLDDVEGRWTVDMVDRQLDHGPTGKVARAYHRNDLLMKRLQMMQAWGEFATSKIAQPA